MQPVSLEFFCESLVRGLLQWLSYACAAGLVGRKSCEGFVIVALAPVSLDGSLLRKSCARFILSTEYLCRLLSALGGETTPPPVPVVHRFQFMAGRGEGKLLGKCQETLKDIPRDVPPSHTLP